MRNCVDFSFGEIFVGHIVHIIAERLHTVVVCVILMLYTAICEHYTKDAKGVLAYQQHKLKSKGMCRLSEIAPAAYELFRSIPNIYHQSVDCNAYILGKRYSRLKLTP